MSYILNTAINNVILNGVGNRAIQLEGVIHTTNQDVFLSRITNLFIVSDFENKIGDDINIEVVLPAGDFINFIKPFKDNLELSLIIEKNGNRTHKKYKAILNGHEFKDIKQQKSNSELNETGVVIISLQLINLYIEALKTIPVYGSYPKTTVTDLILSELNQGIKTLVVGDNNKPVVTLTRMDNTRTYSQIIIPTDTMLLDLPMYLQQKDYGVYNGDIGIFLKQDKLNVYPLYNTEKRNDKEITILHTENVLHNQQDKTFINTENMLTILSDHQDQFLHPSEETLSNTGVGFEYLDSDSVLSRSVNVTKSNINTDPKHLRGGNSLKKKSDDTYLIRKLGSINNVYRERGKILKDNGGVLRVIWKFSDMDLLTPAMTGTYIYEEDSELVKYRISLQNIVTRFDNVTNQSNSTLEFYVGERID